MSGAFVLGAGPGLGTSVAKRFALAGMPVGLVARASATVQATAAALASSGVPIEAVVADATDEPAVRAALDRLESRFGVPDVLVYNAALIRADFIGDLSLAEHLRSWAVNVGGAITAAGHVLPRMAARGRGTMLLTGGMPRPLPEVASLSLGKAGVRTLTEMLADEYGPSGVHVATVTVCGPVAPGTAFDPDDIATEYLRLHRQPPEQWEHRVDYTGPRVDPA
jgi:NAD(P)-dependent dehydrogenase (short-subunit alcohol dehydrogenase family)